MPKLTMLLGLLLIGLGLYGYFVLAGDDPSITALIPAFVGGVFLLLGIVGLSRKLRMHAMHVAVLLALLGAAGLAARGIVTDFPKYFTDREALERPNAVFSQGIMAAACAVYVVLGVFSFIGARLKGGGGKDAKGS